jgi:hypothetical protein
MFMRARADVNGLADEYASPDHIRHNDILNKCPACYHRVLVPDNQAHGIFVCGVSGNPPPTAHMANAIRARWEACGESSGMKLKFVLCRQDVLITRWALNNLERWLRARGIYVYSDEHPCE